MSVGEVILKDKFNNVAKKLRAARDKYYAGFPIIDDVNNSTELTMAKMNALSAQLLAVANRSPLKNSYAYPITVTVGEIIRNTIGDALNTSLTKITSVANCYSNCHSNCHSNCQSSSSCGNSR